MSCGVGCRRGSDPQASSYSSSLTPSLGTYICHGCSPKKQKKEKEKKKSQHWELWNSGCSRELKGPGSNFVLCILPHSQKHWQDWRVIGRGLINQPKPPILALKGLPQMHLLHLLPRPQPHLHPWLPLCPRLEHLMALLPGHSRRPPCPSLAPSWTPKLTSGLASQWLPYPSLPVPFAQPTASPLQLFTDTSIFKSVSFLPKCYSFGCLEWQIWLPTHPSP